MRGLKPDDQRQSQGGNMGRDAVMAAIARQSGQAPQSERPKLDSGPMRGLRQVFSGSIFDRRKALEEQERKASSYADGGRVRPRGFVAGPGTGTSDSIKARLSDGEYVLPADTVAAVGVPALDALKDATHTPVAKPDKNRVGEPLFANAGLVDDERKRNSFGDAAAAANDRGVQQVGAPAAAGGALNPPQKSVPSPVDILRTARGQAQDGSVAARSLDRQIAAQESAAATGKALGDAGRAVVGLFGKPDLGSDVSVFDAPPHPVVPNPTDQRLASGSQQAPGAPAVLPINATDRSGDANMPAMDTGARGLALPPGAAPVVNDPSKPQQVMPGIYRQGNSFGDSPEAASWGARGSKNQNANDLAAADALANRSAQEVSAMAARLQQPTAAGFQPMQAPQVEHSGNSWQARNDLRNAEVSASSIMNNGGRWDQSGRGQMSPERAKYLSMLGADMKARGQEGELPGIAMRENAGLQREGMREQGHNARTAAELGVRGFDAMQRNAIERGRLGLDARRTTLDENVKGIDIRAGQRLEALQNRYAAAKNDSERAAIAKEIRDLSGKTDADHLKNSFMAVGGGQEWDDQAKVMRNVPQRLVDLRTLQEVGAPARQGPAQVTSKEQMDKLPRGTPFIGPDGKQYTKN